MQHSFRAEVVVDVASWSAEAVVVVVDTEAGAVDALLDSCASVAAVQNQVLVASSSCLVRVPRQQPQVETLFVVHVRIVAVGAVVVDGDIVDLAVAEVVEVGLDY